MKNAAICLFLILLFSSPSLVFADSQLEACDPNKVAQAQSGYRCQAGDFIWEVGETTGSGKRVYKDLTGGLLVSGVVAENTAQYGALSLCTDDSNITWNLPSGYPKYEAGKESGQLPKNGRCLWGEEYRDGKCFFPSADSDFVILNTHHVREVVPEVKDGHFWSSSIDPSNTYLAYAYFAGSYGDVSPSFRYGYTYWYAVLCTARTSIRIDGAPKRPHFICAPLTEHHFQT